ncbi:MAG: hypothetical protein IPL49_04765 [Saprospirales bacterium]|nr:hypothetical protein [Saprospirales bacterium]
MSINLHEKPFDKYIHRSLIAQLQAKLPSGSGLKLYPFSLKKGANIHGIIFGASHPRAVDKFLKIAWKRNDTNGEANFDIDEDTKKAQLDLFAGKPLTKTEIFRQRLREKVMGGSISDNFEAFEFTLAEGHLGSQAAEELKAMKKEKLIDYQGTSPLVTYEKAYKEKRRVEYQIIKP